MKLYTKIALAVGLVALCAPLYVGATIFNSGQIGASATIGKVLQTDGTISTWVSTSSLGITGSGTVTSINTTVPLGFTGTGCAITTSGTCAITFTSGYSLPFTASTTQGVNAFASTSALNGVSPITYNGSTGAIGCSTCNTSNATVSSVGLSSTNSSLTIGATPVTTSGTITADINTAHTNTFSVPQNFQNIVATSSTSTNLGVTTGTITSLNFTNATGTALFVTNATTTNFAVTGSATTTFVGGIISPCFATSTAGGCITKGTGGGSSGTVTSITAGTGLSGGAITTSGTIAAYSQPFYTVATTTGAANFTSIQTALNAIATTGGSVSVACGTYTITSEIKIMATGTNLFGQGLCTEIIFDAATSSTALGFNTNDLENVHISGFYIHQKGNIDTGIGFNGSNEPIMYMDNVKIDNTATSTYLNDNTDLTFYQHYNNLDLRANKTCLDIEGNPVNQNHMQDVRCAPDTGQVGSAIFANSNNSNGTQTWQIDSFDSEPNGAGTGVTCLNLLNATDWQINNIHCEGNAVGLTFGTFANSANDQRITINGGLFTGTMPADSSYQANNINVINSDWNSLPYTKLGGNTIIQPTGRGFEANADVLQLVGNNQTAQTAPFLEIDSVNTTDTGTTTYINDQSTVGSSTLTVSGASRVSATKGTCLIFKDSGSAALSYVSIIGTAWIIKTTTCAGPGTTTIAFF